MSSPLRAYVGDCVSRGILAHAAVPERASIRGVELAGQAASRRETA